MFREPQEKNDPYKTQKCSGGYARRYIFGFYYFLQVPYLRAQSAAN
jgi:hypothetical protein